MRTVLQQWLPHLLDQPTATAVFPPFSQQLKAQFPELMRDAALQPPPKHALLLGNQKVRGRATWPLQLCAVAACLASVGKVLQPSS